MIGEAAVSEKWRGASLRCSARSSRHDEHSRPLRPEFWPILPIPGGDSAHSGARTSPPLRGQL